MTGTNLDSHKTKNYTYLSAHGVPSLVGRRWTQDRYSYKNVNTEYNSKDRGALAWVSVMDLPLTWVKFLNFCVPQSLHM